MRKNMQTETILENNNNNEVNTTNIENITREVKALEATRLKEILALGDKHNMKDAAIEFIRR